MITKFKDIHYGKRCFILGNGPSLKEIDLTLIKNEFIFCSNWFLNHQDINILKNLYYCTYDKNFIYPKINEEWKKLIEKNNFMQIFFPMEWKTLFNQNNITYLNYKENIKYTDLKNIDFTSNIQAYNGGSVLINFCIPLAIFMGFKEIILLGVDNNYYPNGQFNPYFYDIAKHKTYFDDSISRNDDWMLETTKAYIKINENKPKDVKIYNANITSQLEVFEKKSFESFIKGIYANQIK
jgi:hypothetical protein